MNLSILKKPSSIIIIILCIALILIIWKPVIPSRYIIGGMADAIDVKNLTFEKPVTVRYELTGKGGGNFNIIADKSKNKAVVVEGDIGKVDLLLAMRSSDFNDLMISMARGKADEYMFMSLVISNKLKIAGDMTMLNKLFSPKGEKKGEEK
jgi:hypothetical protein